MFEAGLQGYTGKYVLTSLTKGVTTINKEAEYKDQRAAASFAWYAQPLGILTEYNVGTGPEYNPKTNAIEQKKLKGGYFLINYNVKLNHQNLLPFVKYQSYDGGKKHELDARSYSVRDLEIGVEWQPNKTFELVTNYTISDRRFEDGTLKTNHQKGNLLRIQAQANF